MPLLIILVLPVLKILTTSLSIGSGGSGGIFGPGLVVGAGVGAAFWALFHHVLPGMPGTPAPFVVVAMMSLFGGVAHAPLAMMLMVGEMTGSYGLLAPAMITVSLASVVVGDRSIYTSQPATRADSPAHRLAYSFPLLHALRVRDARAPPLLILRPQTPVAEARIRMEAADLGEAVVAEEDGTLIGLLTARSLARAQPDKGATAGTTAIATLSVESDEPLDTALSLLAQHHVHRLPVVESETPTCLAGMVTTDGIMRAYTAQAHGDIRRLGLFTGGVPMQDLTLGPEMPSVGVAVRDLGLPTGALIVAVRRAGSTLIPGGDTVLRSGDTLTVAATPNLASLVEVVLCGGAPRAPAERQSS